MAEETKEVVLTGEDISKYLESMDAGTAANKLYELVSNIRTLLERIQDLITDEQMLAAAGALSFTAVLTAAGDAQASVMLGTGEDVLIGLHELTENYKKLHLSKDDIDRLEELTAKEFNERV